MTGVDLLAVAALMSFVVWTGEEWMTLVGLAVTGSLCAGAAIVRLLGFLM